VNAQFTSHGYPGSVFYRADSPDGPYRAVGSVDEYGCFGDSGVEPEHTYYYRMRLVAADGTPGLLSEPAEVATPGLAAASWFVAGASGNRVGLQFHGPSAGLAAAEVLRGKSPGGPFATVGVTGEGGFVDDDVPDGVWHYTVRYVWNGYESALADPIRVAVGDAEDVPEELFPGDPSVQAPGWAWFSSGSPLLVNAQFTSHGYPGSVFYRADSPDGPYRAVGAVDEYGCFGDSGVEPEHTYYYRMRLVAADGTQGLLSEPAEVTTPGLAAASWFVAGASGNRVGLQFHGPSAGLASAEVLRGESPDGPFATVGVTGEGGFVDEDVPAGIWHYTVRYVLDGYESALAEPIMVAVG
jgi:hypothetical protein